MTISRSQDIQLAYVVIRNLGLPNHGYFRPLRLENHI